MSSITPELIEALSNHQNAIWQTVSLTVSEAAGQGISFTSPLVVNAKTSDLYSELGQAMVVIQFSFASFSENSQVILLPQETALELASLIADEEFAELDEAALASLRPSLEGLVQGLCLAVGNVKNETIVASSLNIRFQIFTFPMNMQKASELVRTQVALTAEGLSGAAIWLQDFETAAYIAGFAIQDDEGKAPFEAAPAATAGAQGGRVSTDDSNGLDLLLDIPLEISVELGRVRMLVKDVVELGTGSIVEIDKAAGEPVDVMVNGRLVARGEVVVIEDNFGVRVTEIVSPQERLARLGEVA
jgi:flagellar motor switch protein FliN/FliY